MIREILPNCGSQTLEVVLTTYRMWHCWDCGLEFSMKTRERPKICPRCLVVYEDAKCVEDAF
jgi:rubrerythrin